MVAMRVVNFGLAIASSTLMILLNKYVATEWQDHFSILFAQGCSTVVLNFAGARTGVFPPLKPFTAQHWIKFAPPSVILVVMLSTSLKALPHVAVGTVIVFRACCIVLVAAADRLGFGNTDATSQWQAFTVIVGGAVVYGFHDLTFDPFGYMVLSFNAVLYVTNHIYEKCAISGTSDQTSEGIAIAQNAAASPMFLALALLRRETPMAALGGLSVPVLMAFVATCVGGFVLNLSNIRLNKSEPMTLIALASWTSKLLSLLLGPVLFSYRMSATQTLGVLLSMAGAAETQLHFCALRFGPCLGSKRARVGLALLFALAFGLLQITGDAWLVASRAGALPPRGEGLASRELGQAAWTTVSCVDECCSRPFASNRTCHYKNLYWYDGAFRAVLPSSSSYAARERLLVFLTNRPINESNPPAPASPWAPELLLVDDEPQRDALFQQLEARKRGRADWRVGGLSLLFARFYPSAIGHDVWDNFYAPFLSLAKLGLEREPFTPLVKGGLWANGRPVAKESEEVVALIAGRAPLFESLFREDAFFRFDDVVAGSGYMGLNSVNALYETPGYEQDAMWKFRGRTFRALFGEEGVPCAYMQLPVVARHYRECYAHQQALSSAGFSSKVPLSAHVLVVENKRSDLLLDQLVAELEAGSAQLGAKAGMAVTVGYLRWKEKRTFARQVQALSQADVYVTGVGTASLWACFIKPGGTIVHLGERRKSPLGERYVTYMEEHMFPAMPFLRTAYYTDLDYTIAGAISFIGVVLASARREPPSASRGREDGLSPVGKAWREMCRLDPGGCEEVLGLMTAFSIPKGADFDVCNGYAEDIFFGGNGWYAGGPCPRNLTAINAAASAYLSSPPWSWTTPRVDDGTAYTHALLSGESKVLGNEAAAAAFLEEVGREGPVGPSAASALDCAAVVKPVDQSPGRSPQAMHSALAPRFAGKDLVELGSHRGDGVSCYARVARSTTVIEPVASSCRFLEGRSAELGSRGVGNYTVLCGFFPEVFRDGDVFTFWEDLPVTFRNLRILRSLRRLQDEGKVRQSAEAVVLFDPRVPYDRLSWRQLRRLFVWQTQVEYDEELACTGGTRGTGGFHCSRAKGTFLAAALPVRLVPLEDA